MPQDKKDNDSKKVESAHEKRIRAIAYRNLANILFKETASAVFSPTVFTKAEIYDLLLNYVLNTTLSNILNDYVLSTYLTTNYY